MNIAIITILSLALVFQLTHFLHMFQLNFYKTDMHLHWCKQNFTRLILFSIPALGAILGIFNILPLQIIGLIFASILLLLSIPKKRAKIKFKITGRVLRLFAVEFVFIALILFAWSGLNSSIIKLSILNIWSVFICLIANFVLYPIQIYGEKRYISRAKQVLAQHPNLTIIGITGSYGKTSMKNFLYELLSTKYSVLLPPKNYNTQLGIARTIITQLKPTHQFFICEMGAMWRGEIAECCEIAEPNVGILTSIGPQHLQTFKTQETITETKFELVDYINRHNGTIFLNFDNDLIRKHAIEYKFNEKPITYGLDDISLNDRSTKLNNHSTKKSASGEKLNAYSTKLKTTENGQSFTFCQEKDSFDCQTKLLGKHNIENLTGAIAVAKHFGVSDKNIQFAVKRIKSVKHRLELTRRGNINIIDDSYNSNPVSSKLAIDTFCEFNGRHIVVTPGLIELGDEEKRFNQELGEHIAQQQVDMVYLVGRDIQAQAIGKGLQNAKFDANKIQFVQNHQEAVQYASRRWASDKLNILLLNDLPDNYKV